MLATLDAAELESAGGICAVEIAGGAGLVGAALIGIASAPISVPLLAGAFITSVAAGFLITDSVIK